MYKSLLIPLLLFFTVIGYAQQPAACKIDTNGYDLLRYYRSLDVEHLWLKGHHVDWETGIQDRDDDESNKRTHCSRFVAAACKRVDIYILRPPEFNFKLMANAQFDWLMSPEAKKNGWVLIVAENVCDEYYRAQQHADRGYVTVAVYKNDDPHKSGHIALVIPANVTYDELKAGGPMLIQAGHFNSSATPLIRGFEKHISSWPETKILFYYNTNRPVIR